MANKIATEQEAKTIGGSSITATTNKMCTKTKAISFGCTVSGTYQDNMLIALTDLSKIVQGSKIIVRTTRPISSVNNYKAITPLYFKLHESYQTLGKTGMTGGWVFPVYEYYGPDGDYDIPEMYTSEYMSPVEGVTDDTILIEEGQSLQSDKGCIPETDINDNLIDETPVKYNTKFDVYLYTGSFGDIPGHLDSASMISTQTVYLPTGLQIYNSIGYSKITSYSKDMLLQANLVKIAESTVPITNGNTFTITYDSVSANELDVSPNLNKCSNSPFSYVESKYYPTAWDRCYYFRVFVLGGAYTSVNNFQTTTNVLVKYLGSINDTTSPYNTFSFTKPTNYTQLSNFQTSGLYFGVTKSVKVTAWISGTFGSSGSGDWFVGETRTISGVNYILKYAIVNNSTDSVTIPNDSLFKSSIDDVFKNGSSNLKTAPIIFLKIFKIN